MDSSSMVLSLPALGQDVQLGMLYDVRTAQFFGGMSLWTNDMIDRLQTLDDHTAQDAGFTYSYSLEEARSHMALNVESSLSRELGIIKATGSARYLNDKKSSTFEARVDVSCTIVRRTRRIPQEILASVQHERNLEDPHFTHFVAEVVEGGNATLSFIQPCSSSEDAKRVLAKLKLKIVDLSGDAGVFLTESDSTFESLKISYSGAMAEYVSNIEDACRVAREMHTKLGKQLNTLSYKLLPLYSTINRVICHLDTNLVTKTAAALKAGNMAQFKLKDLTEQDVFQNSFPMIGRQILNIQTAFAAAEMEFTQSARCLLPELRDGTTNYRTKLSELQMAVALFEQRTGVTEQFISKKCNEAYVLRETIALLLADGFENHLDGLTGRSLTDTGAPKLLLSFGGTSISRSQHPLQKSIESSKPGATNDNDSDSSNEDGDDDDEWFENPQTVANVREACTALRRQRSLALSEVTFGVGGVDKAYRPGRERRTKTNFGDIVLDYKGKLLIVSGMLPKAPTEPTLTIEDQTITVAWFQERGDYKQAIPTTGFIVRFRPRPNLLKDGPFPRALANGSFVEVDCSVSETTVVIDKAVNSGTPLFDDCDYEVELSVETIVGRSDWSKPAKGRTLKLPSVASKMIEFYQNNSIKLSRSIQGVKPWELHESGDKKTLYLGLTERDLCACTNTRFIGELAVRIVDVAAEFEPNIPAASTKDRDNTIVAVFTGCSGHGKSTEINSFISYLLGGCVEDSARIMVIDDRGASTAYSVTQHVTCYRIRPLSPLFEGKTLLIVDTPGYGDTRGPKRDAFVTAAMSEFFKTIEHVNAIIFTCLSNEARTTILSPISTYVFSLFAKDVRDCLRTIYTFSDAGAPLARTALKELSWPVDNGEVEVNNAAFTTELDARNAEKVRDWWLISVKGQSQVMNMLLRMRAVPSAGSASVTETRLNLEQRCELVEKKIYRTANDAQNLISRLDALATSIGASPGVKIPVIQDRLITKPVLPGKHTTLCLDCKWTCHRVCKYGDDNKKARCIAMSDENCTMCEGRCHWKRHTNARYTIESEKYTEWVIPDDLISHWNKSNNTLEGALINAMDSYLKLQNTLSYDILSLARLTEKLMNTALLHNPNALLKYIERLIDTAKAKHAPTEQINQLNTAKNTLLLLHKVKEQGVEATRDSHILFQIIDKVREEMNSRMQLAPKVRAQEEEKPCNLYNKLHAQLPPEIRSQAPAPLKERGFISLGARYPDNLKAIVKLVRVVLNDGGVVAAIAAFK
jgi:GTP-binding protein EngB required for normal cell division